MQVIKALSVRDDRLVSTAARGKWKKDYAEGVKTEPDVGYLFAFSRRDLAEARRSMGAALLHEFWLAEAEVVGRIHSYSISMHECRWRVFWSELKLRLRERGASYILCSSITLIKRLA